MKIPAEIKVVAFALLVLCLPPVGAAYYFVSGSPTYSLYRLRAAFHDGDKAEFYTYFDTARVAQSEIVRASEGTKAVPIQSSVAASLLRRQIDRLMDSADRDTLGHAQLESLERDSSTARATISSDSRRISLTLEQQPDRRWKVIDLDLGSAGLAITEGGGTDSVPTP